MVSGASMWLMRCIFEPQRLQSNVRSKTRLSSSCQGRLYRGSTGGWSSSLGPPRARIASGSGFAGGRVEAALAWRAASSP